MKIQDGSGQGFEARVDGNNRFHTQSVTETEGVHATILGDAYNINTGLFTVSTDNSTLLYFKNNETQKFIIETLVVGEGTGITHSASPYITIVANPTGGDLITDASAVAANANRNFSSSRTLSSSLAYKGKSGGTLTGGTTVGVVQISAAARTSVPLNFVLEKGSSVGISLDANITSGSASYYAAIIGYLKDSESED